MGVYGGSSGDEFGCGRVEFLVRVRVRTRIL